MDWNPSLLESLAREYGTPLYVYDEGMIRDNFRRFHSAFQKQYEDTKTFYAYKANSNLAILHILRQEGAKADVVSEGEMRTALKVGLDPEEIIFSNNAKKKSEIREAVDSEVILNADSMDELYRIQAIAKDLDKNALVSFRVNPSIDPMTHPKIATGMKSSKFGLHIHENNAFKAYRFARDLDYITLKGLHMHIGSQIKNTKPFVEATEKLMNFASSLNEKLGITLDFIDLGGGLGIPYEEDSDALTPEDLAKATVPVFKEWTEELGYEPELWLEPGRYVLGPAGVLVTEVQSVKETPYRKFINLDAGFQTLVRPAMYDSYHGIENISSEYNEKVAYDVAGNICESGDVFAEDRKLKRTKAEDFVVIYDTGAYGFAMSSQYNSRPRPMEILLWEDSAEVIRERENWNDLYRHQRIPEDLL